MQQPLEDCHFKIAKSNGISRGLLKIRYQKRGWSLERATTEQVNIRKTIDFVITNDGCYECTSHYKDEDGYPRIQISKQSKPMSRHIYTECFGDIPEGLVVRHKCDNPSCINPEHLELGTKTDNMTDRCKRGRTSKGDDHHWAKLTEKDVREIRKSSMSLKQIMCRYNIAQSTASSVRSGKSWKHVKMGD